MSREQSARDAVQGLIPDDTIVDVALTYPRGFTKAQAYGMAAGGLIGGDDFVSVGLVAGSAVGGRIFTNLKELPPTSCSLCPTRRSTRWAATRWASTLELTLTDTEHDVSVELEAKRLGNLGIKTITELLTSS